MFARKKIFISLRVNVCLLILFSVVLWAPYANAQQRTDDADKGVPVEAALVKDGSVKDESVKDKPVKDESAKEEPAKEEPAKEESAKEESAKEEPAKEEPVNNEPAIEEPVKEEPVEEPGNNRRIERLGDVSANEWEMDLALPAAAPVTPGDAETALPDAAQNQELQQLLSKLASSPDDSKILTQLNALLADVLSQAADLMNLGSVEEAKQLLAVIQSIDPNQRGLKSARSHLKSVQKTAGLLAAGKAALEAQRSIEPEKDNALYYFNQVLQKDPENSQALSGLTQVQEALIERANGSAQELDFETAEQWLQRASAVQVDQTLVDEARVQLAAFQNMHATDLEDKALAALDAGKFDAADLFIIDLIALGGQEDRVKDLRAQLKEARYYGGFEPGQVISDTFLDSDEKAPEIVVIAAGSFLMGSSNRSGGAFDNEQPRHRVTIERGFGLGVTEVTVGQFRKFVESSGYQTTAERTGSSIVYDEVAGRLSKRKGINWRYDYQGEKAQPDEPVLHINSYDARAYVGWLAAKTGKKYRLPSEAEYEYVARAGGSGTFWWGEGSPAKIVENLTGQRDRSPSKRSWTTPFKKYGDGYWGPAPAGSLRDDDLVHPMGVYDIAGNVSEWVADCWHQNYVKAPVDGSAWVNPGCTRTVVRGGYWASAPEQSRAAFRISAKPETVGPVVGMRIARDL